MRWRKLGRIYCAEGSSRWARSHAFLPTPMLLTDRIRVYVAFLDEEKVGRVGYVELATEDPRRILRMLIMRIRCISTGRTWIWIVCR